MCTKTKKKLPTNLLTPLDNVDKSQALLEFLSLFFFDFLVLFNEKNQFGIITELTESDLNRPKLL